MPNGLFVISRFSVQSDNDMGMPIMQISPLLMAAKGENPSDVRLPVKKSSRQYGN